MKINRSLFFNLALLTVAIAASFGCALDSQSCCDSEPLVELGRIEEPSLAILPGEKLVGAWASVNPDGQAEILFSRFSDQSESWTAPRRVSPTSGTAVAGRQVGPRLAVLSGGEIAIAWVDRARDSAGDVFVAVSADGGKTFTPPARANDDAPVNVGQEYHDITPTKDGGLATVWLDERDAPAGEENRKQLYLAVSKDGKDFSSNERLTNSDNGVCPCCRPQIVSGEDGSLHVIYRDRVGEKLFVRVLSRQADEQRFTTTTLSDGWVFPGCPVNGPAIAVGPGGRLWALWVEGENEEEQLWWSRSNDRGKTFSAKRRFLPGPADRKPANWPSGVARHLALGALDTGAAVAVWENHLGKVWTAILSDSESEMPSSPTLVAGGLSSIARSPSVATFHEVIRLCWIEEDILSFVNDRSETHAEHQFPRHRRLELTGQMLRFALSE